MSAIATMSSFRNLLYRCHSMFVFVFFFDVFLLVLLCIMLLCGKLTSHTFVSNSKGSCGRLSTLCSSFEYQHAGTSCKKNYQKKTSVQPGLSTRKITSKMNALDKVDGHLTATLVISKTIYRFRFLS